ncbi:MAG: hypothetical protein GF398_19015 [Chitinivibrionales bacterium]|nr:hypothetical protein [Chitinivibrionales bacterium]
MEETYKSLEEILEKLKRFHERMSALFSDIKSRRHNERVRYILQYLGDNERNNRNWIAEYLSEIDTHSKKIWLQFLPDNSVLFSKHDLSSMSIENEDDVKALVMSSYRKIIDYLNSLCSVVDNEKVQEVGETLKNRFEQQLKKIISATEQFEDM